mgnify:CR=1 FL=1
MQEMEICCYKKSLNLTILSQVAELNNVFIFIWMGFIVLESPSILMELVPQILIRRIIHISAHGDIQEL